MTIESAADLAGFYSTDDFAETVTYTLAGGDPVSLAVIFDNPSSEVSDGEGPGTLVTEARFTCPESALPDGAAEGDAVSRGGTGYEVRAIFPDGLGVAKVELERVS